MLSKLKSPNTSLRARMLFILVLAGVPGIVIAIFLTVQKFSEETLQIETSVSRLAAIGAAHHEAVISHARVLLEAIVGMHKTPSIGQLDCRTYLKDWTD